MGIPGAESGEDRTMDPVKREQVLSAPFHPLPLSTMAHSQANPSQSTDDLVRRYADLLCERIRDTDYPAWKVRHDAFLASLGEREDEVRNEYDRRSEWENDRRAALWEESQR